MARDKLDGRDQSVLLIVRGKPRMAGCEFDWGIEIQAIHLPKAEPRYAPLPALWI